MAKWARISLVVVASWAGIARGQASRAPGAAPDLTEFCPGADLHRWVSSGTMAGQAIKRPFPTLPPEAIKAHVNGAVFLRVCIGADGRVKNVSPISGPEMLRKSYMDAVSRWEYRPYLVDGKPVPVITTIGLSMSFGGG